MVWILHGRQTNHKINKFHESALRIEYNDYGSSSQDLLSKDNSFTIHHQNMQSLAAKICKILDNILGGTFEGLFTLRTDNYSLPSEQDLIIPKVSNESKWQN